MTVALATVALGSAASAAGDPALAAAPAGTDRKLGGGPFFAGGRVVWSDRTGTYSWSDGRARRLARLPEGAVVRAASASVVVFVDGAGVAAGPRPGPFTRLVPANRCALPWLRGGPAAAGTVVAYEQVDCRRHTVPIVVRDLARPGSRLVLRDVGYARACCAGVRIAGPFVAYSDHRDSKVVVYDRRARRIGYEIDVPKADRSHLAFDVQQDGKVAIATRAGVSVYSPRQPRPNELRLAGDVLQVRGEPVIRFANDRVLVGRSLGAGKAALVLVEGVRHRTLARFEGGVRPAGEIAFDGTRIAWAADRVAATEEVCPRVGEGPCRTVETGTTTIWVGALRGPRRVAVARLPFIDR